MTVYERIEQLRTSEKISQGKLEKELGFSNGSISKWKNSMPTPERLQKIADYFGVSMEYLMAGTEKGIHNDSVERVKQICKERKIPISKMEKDLEYSNGYIGQLRKGVFPSDRLQKIADYLGVSVDYLMTGKEDANQPAPELSNVYFSLAKEAQQNGIDPRDIKMAIEMLKKIREEEKNQ